MRDESKMRPADVSCSESGEPVAIIWAGRVYPIEKILARRRDVHRKTGRIGTRYTVTIRGQQRDLFHSPRPRPERWLLEVHPRRPETRPGARHCCVDLRWGIK